MFPNTHSFDPRNPGVPTFNCADSGVRDTYLTHGVRLVNQGLRGEWDRTQPVIDLGPSSAPTPDQPHHIMDSSSPTPSNQSGSTSRGRGGSRGRGNRGGLGKYLRARGRKGTGPPAVWKQRLLLEGEGPDDEDSEEAREAKEEMARKYSRRQLGSNTERYKEEEPELDSEGAYFTVRTDPDAGFLIARCWLL